MSGGPNSIGRSSKFTDSMVSSQPDMTGNNPLVVSNPVNATPNGVAQFPLTLYLI